MEGIADCVLWLPGSGLLHGEMETRVLWVQNNSFGRRRVEL